MQSIDDARHVEHIQSVVNGSVMNGPRAAEPRVDGYVSRSWRRCLLDYELDPAAMREPPTVETDELGERRERHSRLLSIAKVEMTNLYQQVANSGYAILLTDTDGVVLNYIGDPVFNDTATRTGLQSGAIWTEQAQGTNGMGTCLVERRPLVIHRQEHFFAKNTTLTCSSAPILGPDGNLVAVLDASSQSRMAQQHTVVLVNMSAQMIENRLYLNAHNDDHIARFHSRPEFVSTLGEGAVAFDGSGRILSANRSALFQLDLEEQESLLGKDVAEIFGLPFSALMDLAAQHPFHPVPLHYVEDGRRFFTIIQRPEREFVRARRAPQRRPKAKEDCHLSRLEFGDPVMAANIRQAKRLVDTDIPVILYGETGTGKGLFSKCMHDSGSRSGKPFIPVNCASIPETLIESELFGYRPGAFTGASRQGSRGKIVQANGGTLFLDEIGDMPLALQARLLRVLEEKEVVPLGGESPIKVDVKVISATHRSLPTLIAEGKFREDLYYRLHGTALTLPPLRERADRCQLIERLLHDTEEGGPNVRLTPEALEALARFPWPGNIRQLCNVLRTVLALRDSDTITLAALPDEIVDGAAARMPQPGAAEEANSATVHDPLASAERAALLHELETRRWNVAKVARSLNLSRNTLYRKMKRYGIKPPR